MIIFPEYITCIIKDGYQVNTEFINGYGERSINGGTKLKITVIFSSDMDKQLFAIWLLNDLSNAGAPFLLDAPIWGVRNYNYEREDGNKYDGWLVRFITNEYILDKLKGNTNELTLDIQLLDDIELLCRFSRKDC